MKLCLAFSAMALCACSAVPVAKNSQQQIHVGANGYFISQLTAGTWIAVAQATGKPMPRSSADRTVLVDAIAKISGCKVTDVNYSQDGLQLDAQVDCGGRRGN